MSSGIKHLEDLQISEYLDIVSNIEKFKVTEKCDGANLRVGIDERGLYTTREHKGGKRIHNHYDYDIKFSTTYMRFAHKALAQMLPQLRKDGFKLGDELEIEVLYGSLPNVVPYSENANYIIFLSCTKGDFDISKMSKLPNVKIELIVPFTRDGITIEEHVIENRWEFSTVPLIDIGLIKETKMEAELAPILGSLRSYLASIDETYHVSNFVLFQTQLNKKPTWLRDRVWGEVKKNLPKAKNRITLHINDYKTSIKKILLTYLVRNRRSCFGKDVDHSWIEGVVLHNHKTIFKIVDKDLFLNVKNFSWNERTELKTLIKKSPNLTANTLHKHLEKYIANKGTLTIAVDGREFIYTDEINNRTLQSYAEAFKNI
jgi:hypothetical protein